MEQIRRFKERIEETLHSLFPLKTSALYEGARYLLFATGKRIRPLFTLAIADLCGKNCETLLYPACALEVIHTYSLIHDDLPCMDNDDFRRGKPTLHRVYDEATALLIGDYLLTYAFEIMTKGPLASDIKLKMIQILSHEAGACGMIGGQLMDLQKKANFQEINVKKTGALFKTAFHFGALGHPQEKAFALLGEKVGLLFQNVDDILDGERSEPIQNDYEEIVKELSSYQNHDSCLYLVDQIVGQIRTTVR